ncbi:OmpA/MotB family protein [Mongoliitalea daihaiensis]|uniref:OmpA/MotB family protein n=1 Tax=Mongoliitalea daihaiensis TaxID=2782006 RepID=UPI001F4668B2|nr:OmpA family protein [Mongoliitalea daihaiensis]UJP65135.1 OmpA family protein [Mongoliitalea daihaiensis]
MSLTKKGSKSEESNWVSFSDIMTGLMVIFMFIAISYILEVQKKQEERDELFEEFQATKESLYNALDSAFREDFNKWKVELDKDLSIKFTNPDVLFASGQTEIRPYFREILDEFLPVYFEIVLQDRYRDKISEIRIEGHTDQVPAYNFDTDPYIGNIKLSQLRSAQVLKYFRNMDFFRSLPEESVQLIQFWLTANGLSYGRTLDDNKNLTSETGLPVNNEFSRRVEFRIVTTSDKLVERVIQELSGR